MTSNQQTANTILIVEGSSVQAKIVSRHIESMTGFATVIAYSMEEASNIITDMRDDIFAAVACLALPDAPNGEIADLILKNNIASIILTATFNDEVRDTLLLKNVADYVIKESMITLDIVVEDLDRLFKNQYITTLVVDDSRTASNRIRKLLEIQNYNVLTAEDGLQALEAVKNNPEIRLMVTDYEMPNMNGLDLVQELRKTHKKDSIAIIGVSGAQAKALTAKFLKRGANDFLHKSFEPEEFTWRVSQTMNSLEYLREINELKKKQ